ncbi:type ISP restriction/modification enzyme [Streptomyces sp. SCSIO 30461]|uniref:type ISP restriction/modification enzyme n=1 Tax=Streptomyces sp. SCSIO 30461 TaxID=3118085 RepID=UPI0030CA7932
MLLDDLMPWSTGPLRLGRDWVIAPDTGTLRARWDMLVSADEGRRRTLFGETRARTLHSAVAALPGQSAGTAWFAGEGGACPDPVRIVHGPFDRQWIIPDHRLIDIARPELWRVADERQLFVQEPGRVPGVTDPALLVSADLPDGRSPAGRPGRIRPLYRRLGGTEPNLAMGVLPALSARYARTVGAEEVLAWAVATAQPSASPARGYEVPFSPDPELWADGVRVGRQLVRIQLRGARGTERPRLPGGRRPYVRASLPARPEAIAYDADEEALLIGTGRISPVPAEAWDYAVSGVRVLEHWFERRTAEAEPGTLAAIGPGAWPQEWTSELLELITVLALLGGLESERRTLSRAVAATGSVDLELAPASEAARRPASVLDHHEEGPAGQVALI